MISRIDPGSIPVAAFTDEGGLCDHRQPKVPKAADRVTGDHPAMLDPIAGLRALRLKRRQSQSQLGTRHAVHRHRTTPLTRAGDPSKKVVEVRKGMVIQ